MPHRPASATTTRRDFIRLATQGAGVVAAASFLPGRLLAATPTGIGLVRPPAQPVLVVIQLAGGNDGLNTVVPRGDSRYRQLRPTLALTEESLLPLTAEAGLHPACLGLAGLYRRGKLAVIQNVGYPEAARSHFSAAAVWDTARLDAEPTTAGWIARWANLASQADGPVAAHLGRGFPRSFRGAASGRTWVRDHADGQPAWPETKHDGIEGAEALPAQADPGLRHPLVAELTDIAARVSAGFPARIYTVTLAGFDTHANQAVAHAHLLATLSQGLAHFQHELERRGVDSRVLTLVTSEFGRSPAENAARGTDHGTTAPVFLIGSSVAGGVMGAPPRWESTSGNEPWDGTDFRRIYATLLDRWMQADASTILGADYDRLDLLA